MLSDLGPVPPAQLPQFCFTEVLLYTPLSSNSQETEALSSLVSRLHRILLKEEQVVAFLSFHNPFAEVLRQEIIWSRGPGLSPSTHIPLEGRKLCSRHGRPRM